MRVRFAGASMFMIFWARRGGGGCTKMKKYYRKKNHLSKYTKSVLCIRMEGRGGRASFNPILVLFLDMSFKSPIKI